MNRLEGKVALVTGAARGIGEAIARTFVEHGAFVYVTDIDDELGSSVARALGARRSTRVSTFARKRNGSAWCRRWIGTAAGSTSSSTTPALRVSRAAS